MISIISIHGMETIFTKKLFGEALGLILVEENMLTMTRGGFSGSITQN